ncbi:hypothetical protein Mth01_42530 [Sphaerimonospora thailandensis]|uniref:Protein kinase domain-containing protein n=1 Tax=Sphaerimonospora thailandensis TaxID=795644 RepID=A0A8J3RCC0_9ACTN|nr:hypothetical protein Mth01_42530 [Sphaerimonospora thailandensis]
MIGRWLRVARADVADRSRLLALSRGVRGIAPKRLGGYVLGRIIGEGGQGVVYLGKAPDGTKVAVKVLHARFPGDDDTRRFLGEVTATRQVAAFCTARVIDAGMDSGQPYIVSEYVEGVSLAERVRREGPRDAGGLTRLAVGTMTALMAIHEAGIVHRDFKPSNVLLGPEGPVVIDFGIAKVLDPATVHSSVAMGTPWPGRWPSRARPGRGIGAGAPSPSTAAARSRPRTPNATAAGSGRSSIGWPGPDTRP